MCGVAGVFHFRSPLRREVVSRMNSALAHRGPDDSGSYFGERIGLAHTRLAIIDPKGGRQPLFNEDRSIVLVSSGEIYNYVELGKTLADLGHEFATRSDAEVIVHAYEQWGDGAWGRFNGMFAFALWDSAKETLYLVRDRIGIKPMYYHLSPDRLVFASEVKAILQDEAAPCAPDPSAVVGFFIFQNLLDDRTFFRNIRKLMPGQFLRASKSGVERRSYWAMEFEGIVGGRSRSEYVGCCRGGSPHPPPSPLLDHSRAGAESRPYKTQRSARHPKEYVEEFKAILNRSVKRHLIADVPVGSMLSGGFDSSAVAVTAAGIRGDGPMDVFTAAYDEGPDYDERACTRRTAARMGAKLHEVVVTARDYRDHIEDVIYHLDEPAPGSAALGHFLVSRLAAERVKVILTGHGGDELLGGYHVYKSARILQALQQQPGMLPRLLFSLRRDELGRVLYFLLAPLWCPEVRGGLINLFPQKAMRRLFTDDFLENTSDDGLLDKAQRLIARKGLDPYQKVFTLYLRTYLPSLLIQEDKLGMAHGIESRTPFLDNEMVDFAMRTPLDMKLHNGELKYITKAAMRGRLPDTIYAQPKMGFPTPYARWYRNELWDMANDILLGKTCRERGIWRADFIQRLLNNHRRRTGETLYDYLVANRIYSLISAELWCRIYADKRGAR